MDLHAWITQQVDAVKRDARYSLDEFMYLDCGDQVVADHYMRAGSPEAVLRRCEADRRILARHLPQPDGTPFPDGQQCRTCSEDGGDGYQYLVPYPCSTITDLAHAHGITDEILAGLDRPQPPEPKRATGRLGLADILATQPITTSDVPEALHGPHWKP